MSILHDRDARDRDELSFSDLVRCVIKQAQVDEATAKAAILHLNYEGELKITSDWSVRLRPRQESELTREDWAEIYYALDDKLTNPSVSGDRRWIAHLRRILETIGPDGRNMTE